MTPEAKAKELVNNYKQKFPSWIYVNADWRRSVDYNQKKFACQCAIIAIEQFIGDWDKFPFPEYSWEYFNRQLDDVPQDANSKDKLISHYSKEFRQYWQQVKQEIQKLA